MNTLTTVLLAEDNKMLREGIIELLSDQDDMRVVGVAQTGGEAIKLARELHPHVVCMDISMPGLDGLEATRQIRQSGSPVRVLILSAHNEIGYIANAMGWGASGYLLKNKAELLPEAIRKVNRGEVYYSPGIMLPPQGK